MKTAETGEDVHLRGGYTSRDSIRERTRYGIEGRGLDTMEDRITQNCSLNFFVT